MKPYPSWARRHPASLMMGIALPGALVVCTAFLLHRHVPLAPLHVILTCLILSFVPSILFYALEGGFTRRADGS